MSTKTGFKFDSEHRQRRKLRNTAVIPPIHARLRCGHEVTAHPVASLGSLRFFICPKGCGLRRGRKLPYQSKGAPDG